MFWDFGSAVSSQRQAAGDHVQASPSGNLQQQEQRQESAVAAASIGKLLGMPKKTLRSFDTSPKLTSDGEHTAKECNMR